MYRKRLLMRTLPVCPAFEKQYEQVHALLKDWNLSHIEGKLLQEISGGEFADDLCCQSLW